MDPKNLKQYQMYIQKILEKHMEIGTANKLVEFGIPKDKVILAFYPPYKRPYTDFGVA